MFLNETFDNVVILDNKLGEVAEFTLMEHVLSDYSAAV